MQDLMKSAPDTPNVVEACNLEGRQERLDGLLSQLEMCEKALQVLQTNLPVCNYCLAIGMGVTIAASCYLLYTASQKGIPRYTGIASFCRTTWRPSVWPSHASTLWLLQICWTSCPRVLTLSSSSGARSAAIMLCAAMGSMSIWLKLDD